MPGVIVYSECKNKLEQMKTQRPEIFQSRQLFVSVLRLLENYTFKLGARRDIVNLFTIEAKCRQNVHLDV